MQTEKKENAMVCITQVERSQDQHMLENGIDPCPPVTSLGCRQPSLSTQNKTVDDEKVLSIEISTKQEKIVWNRNLTWLYPQQ